MEAIILGEIDDEGYCMQNRTIAFPVSLLERDRFSLDQRVCVEMPLMDCKVIARVYFIERKPVEFVFPEGHPRPPEFEDVDHVYMVGLCFEEVVDNCS